MVDQNAIPRNEAKSQHLIKPSSHSSFSKSDQCSCSSLTGALHKGPTDYSGLLTQALNPDQCSGNEIQGNTSPSPKSVSLFTSQCSVQVWFTPTSFMTFSRCRRSRRWPVDVYSKFEIFATQSDWTNSDPFCGSQSKRIFRHSWKKGLKNYPYTIAKQRVHTTLQRNGFVIRVVTPWNPLAYHVVIASSIACFKFWFGKVRNELFTDLF